MIAESGTDTVANAGMVGQRGPVQWQASTSERLGPSAYEPAPLVIQCSRCSTQSDAHGDSDGGQLLRLEVGEHLVVAGG